MTSVVGRLAEGSRLVLDPAAIAELAARIPALAGATIESIDAEVLWVKPGRHFNGGYELRCTGLARPRIFLSAFALGAVRARRVVAKLSHRHQRTSATACGGCASAATEEGVLLQLFPHDYRLPALRNCFRSAWARSTFPGRGEPLEIRQLAYRPGMRCQILYRFAGGEFLFAKLAVERERGRMARQHKHIERALGAASPGQLGVAPLVHHDDDVGLLVVGAVPGKNLDDILIPGCDAGGILARVSAALAELHGLPSEGLDRIYEAKAEVDLLDGWSEVIAVLFPEMRPQLMRCFSDIVARRPVLPGSDALVHRDFYEKQVVMSDSVTTLLDLDTACRGHAEIDLGNFCAHLRLRGYQSGNLSWCGELEGRFLGLYPRPFTPELVDWYRRCALLRLACVHRLRSGGAELAPALLADARADWGSARR